MRPRQSYERNWHPKYTFPSIFSSYSINRSTNDDKQKFSEVAGVLEGEGDSGVDLGAQDERVEGEGTC